MTKAAAQVLASALEPTSPFHVHVKPGLQALGNHSNCVRESERKVTDSIDFDGATRAAHGHAHRWDYFLGVSGSPARKGGRKKSGSAAPPSGDSIVAVEVHSASEGEVKVVIAKKEKSGPLLRAQLRAGRSVARWVWVASGKTAISPNSKYTRLLATARIELVGAVLHL